MKILTKIRMLKFTIYKFLGKFISYFKNEFMLYKIKAEIDKYLISYDGHYKYKISDGLITKGGNDFTAEYKLLLDDVNISFIIRYAENKVKVTFNGSFNNISKDESTIFDFINFFLKIDTDNLKRIIEAHK